MTAPASPDRPFSTPITAELLHGAVRTERTPYGLAIHRLPEAAGPQSGGDELLARAQAQPSGVRLAFTTTAGSVELRALATRYRYLGAPDRPFGVFDLVIGGELIAQRTLATADVVTVDPAAWTRTSEPDGSDQSGSVVFEGLPGGLKDVEIWLPHNEQIEVGSLHADAAIQPTPARRPRWLHHGSSISHGSNATHPTGTWPAIAARLGGVGLVNLGLSGNAVLDPFTARTIRDLPADAISLKLGLNITNHDLMRRRAFVPAVHGFLDTIREGHRTTPVLLVSPVCCPIQEHTPGPVALDTEALALGVARYRATGDPAEVAAGRLTLAVIREELSGIVRHRAADDPHLHYLDGTELYGPQDALELPLPDDLHPDAAAHQRIGERFAAHAFAQGGPLNP